MALSHTLALKSPLACSRLREEKERMKKKREGFDLGKGSVNFLLKKRSFVLLYFVGEFGGVGIEFL